MGVVTVMELVPVLVPVPVSLSVLMADYTTHLIDLYH